MDLNQKLNWDKTFQVTQLSCSDADVSNTEGCQQYFTGIQKDMKIKNIADSHQFLGITGEFASYGFDSSQMIIGQNYAYCIRSDLVNF